MSAVLTQMESTQVASETPMTPRRVWRAYAVEAKYESLRMLRTPGFAGPFLALPVALYLLFGVLLFGTEIAKDPAAAMFTFLGFSVLGVMGPGIFGFGVSVAVERDQGLLKLKRALPMPTGASLIAKMLMAMLFVAIVMATMAAAAPLGHLRMSAGRLAGVSLLNILGALPFGAMGCFIGTVASGKAAPALANLMYLPMIYLSGILFPLPKSMHWIAELSPAYHLDQLAFACLGAGSEGAPAVHALVLAAVTLGFGALAVRRLARVG